jgi:protein gp37
MSTLIQWTDETWNPIAAFDRETGKRGWFCVHASTGCLNCYAEKRNTWRGNGHVYRAPDLAKVDIRLIGEVLAKPLHWKRPRMVFPCSMTDLFFDAHSLETIARVFAVMALTPQHTYQVLTKRAQRMREVVQSSAFRDLVTLFVEELSSAPARFAWPLPNVWVGVSTENQCAANERVPELLQTPAAVHWVSAEPLLERIDFLESVRVLHRRTGDFDPVFNTRGGIDWIVVGGESGAHARPFDVAWARHVVRQCTDHGVRVFVKQLGTKPGFRLEDEEARGNMAPSFHHYDQASGLYIKKLDDSHGGDPTQWPEELRVREMPERAL